MKELNRHNWKRRSDHPRVGEIERYRRDGYQGPANYWVMFRTN